MPKCSYCGQMYDTHKGLTFVLNSGNSKNFCSSKCRKNFEMKRRKVRWITKQKKSKKELIQEQLKSEEINNKEEK